MVVSRRLDLREVVEQSTRRQQGARPPPAVLLTAAHLAAAVVSQCLDQGLDTAARQGEHPLELAVARRVVRCGCCTRSVDQHAHPQQRLQLCVELVCDLGQRIGQGHVDMTEKATSRRRNGPQPASGELHTEPGGHDVLDGVNFVEDEDFVVR